MVGLVERAVELDRMTAAQRAAAGGVGVTVVVEGVAGVGKTALLDRAAASAGDEGCRVARATGHPLEVALSYGVVRQLLEPLVARLPADRLADLGSGAGRRALALLTGGTAELAEDLELVHATYRLVEQLAAEGPLLLVVDDAQWADRPSATLLLYLSQRIEQLPVSLVVGFRAGEPSEVADLLTRLPGPTTVAPLSEEATAELVRGRFPATDQAVCAECYRVTGGNPLLITELLAGLEGGDGALDRQRVEELRRSTTVSLRRTTAHRLAGVGDDAREVARAVAVLGPGGSLRRVAALSGLSLERCAAGLDALARAGVLTGGEPPGFVHPLVESAVRHDIPDAERALRHRRAAELGWADGDDAEQVAAHLLVATRQGDPVAVETLREAARLARSRGTADSACRYLERALVEPPAPAVRVTVLAELADAEMTAGRADTWDHLGEAVRLAEDPADRSGLLIRTGDLLFQAGRYDEAATAFEHAARERSDPAVESRVRASRLAVEALRPGAVDRPAPPCLTADADAEPGQLVHLALLSVMGVADHRTTRDLVGRAVDRGLGDSGVGLDLLIALSCMVWADMFEECDEVVSRALRASERQASHLAGAHLRFGRSWLRHWAGRLDEAVADAFSAIELWRGGWNGQVEFARFWCAASLVELDRVDQAAEVLDEAELAARGVDPVGRASHRLARGRIATARGEHAEARRQLAAAAEIAAGVPFLHNPSALPWRSDGALAAQVVGDHEAALALAAEEVDLARRYGAPRALGVALRAHGLVVGGAVGLSDLREAVDVLTGSPAGLEEVRARVDLGAALRRAGHRAEAREVLRDGQASAASLGAVRLRERARVELVSAGGRPRREAVRGPDALTPSERRVAELAAGGRSNPDIAAELYISRRTVEFHLRGAFRKLEVSSRRALAEALHQVG